MIHRSSSSPFRRTGRGTKLSIPRRSAATRKPASGFTAAPGRISDQCRIALLPGLQSEVEAVQREGHERDVFGTTRKLIWDLAVYSWS